MRILLGFTGTVISPPGGSERLQHGPAAMGTHLSPWAGDKFPVLRCHPTAGKVLCCRGSRRAGADVLVRSLWWLELPHTPGTAKAPQEQQISLPWQSLELPLTAAHGQAERSVPQSTGGQLRTRVSKRK